MHGSTPLKALNAEGAEADRRHARTFARSMLLTGGAASNEAIGLIDHLVSSILIPSRKTASPIRPSMVRNYREALGPFIVDIFDAFRLGKWAMLETNTNALHRCPGGAIAFTTMRTALGGAGLLEELPGYVRRYEMFGVRQEQKFRTCFRLTPKLLGLAAGFGVDAADFGRHFRRALPSTPVAAQTIVARAEKAKASDRAKDIPVDLTVDRPATILADLQRLNAHLMTSGRIDGIVFGGLRRIFSNADRPDFDWQWHGRFYSMPNADRYEGMSMGDELPHGGARARAKVIRIDGQEVTEVDVSASHLTILHGLLTLPFDPEQDPYALPAVQRQEVKEWLTRALGSGDLTRGGNRLSKARKACIERYPFLSDLLSHGITSLDLQYHESEIVRLAMDELMDKHDVGFLPVHDALMVAKGNEGLAVQALRNGFERYFRDGLGLIAPVPRVL